MTTQSIPITDAPPSRVARKFRVRAVLFLILAVAAGVAAVILVKAYLDQVRRTAPPAPLDTVQLVIARTDVPLGQRIEPGNLALVDWPAAHVPAGAYRELTQVVGQSARQALVAGEPLLPSRLVLGAQGEGLASLLEPGTRAMTVKVDQVVGIAGFLQPADRVDVIATLPTDDEVKKVLATEAMKMSKTILEDIKVLAVGEHLATDGNRPIKVQVVTLAVFPEEAERLALASQQGTVQLTMRARVDHTEVATAGISPLGLLAPDPGATPAVVAGTRVATTTTQAEPETRRVTRTSARTRPPVTPAVTRPTEPQAPVVEILRGTQKIEERKLRPPGGTP